MAEFIEVMKQKKRMCNYYHETQVNEPICNKCGLSGLNNKSNHLCGEFVNKHPQEAEEIIMAWAKAHPIKTNGDKFKEVFGMEVGCLAKCPLYGSALCEKDKVCVECKYDNFWTQEYKEPSKK